ncbi:MAG: hypothetical protein WCK02_01920 [Bacteroidota bacterium]
MKTTKILTVCAAMFLTLSAFSNPTGKSSKATRNNSTEITYKTFESTKVNSERVIEIVGSIVSLPKIENNNQEGVVIVEYHIEDNGNVVVDQINSSNQILAESVKTQIESLYLMSSVGSEKKFYAKFNFKKL